MALMTRIAARLKEKSICLWGYVLRNDTIASLSITHLVGGKFVRVNILRGAIMTDQGIIESEAYNVLWFRKALGAKDVKIFADIYVKHAIQLRERPIP